MVWCIFIFILTLGAFLINIGLITVDGDLKNWYHYIMRIVISLLIMIVLIKYLIVVSWVI